MKKYFLDVIIKHYCDFSGKATRTQFWSFTLIIFIPFFCMCLDEQYTNTMGLIYSLIFLLPFLGIAARRLRDGGFSPWLLLLMLIPILGWIALLILYLMPSK